VKRLIVDLDGTITVHNDHGYENAVPNKAVIEQLREYKKLGFEIVISTSRNMRTYGGNSGMIAVHTLPVILNWLKRHDVPHDEVYIAKPWCGENGFYIDDRAIRPSEFVDLSYKEICQKLGIDEE